MKQRHLRYASTCFALIAISLAGGAYLGAESFAGTQILADFSAIDLSDQQWDEEVLKGKIVLIDFWATWCGPCLEEFPHLKEIYKKYHRQGLEIIGVSLDTSGRLELERWLRRHRIPWPQVADFRGYEGELALRYGIKSIPASLLLNREGELTGVNLRGKPLSDRIKRLCREPAPEGAPEPSPHNPCPGNRGLRAP